MSGMSWNPFRPMAPGSGTGKHTRSFGAGVLLTGTSVSSASAAPRADVDFGRQPVKSEVAGGLRCRFVRAYRRLRDDSMSSGQLLSAGGDSVSAEQDDARWMSAALTHVLPRLKGRQDEGALAGGQAVVGRLLALDRRCASVAEYGISIERVLCALGDRCGKLPLNQALNEAEAFLRELDHCMAPAGADGKPSREQLARVALLLAMPALCPYVWAKSDRSGVLIPHQTDRASRALAKELAALDAHFSGRPGYAFDRLFSVLCNHARILEYGRTEGTLEMALTGLGAMVATVEESIGPDRDGYALNALVGMDGELDKAIVDLRSERVREIMEDHLDPEQDAPELAAEHAKDLVQQETELALARVRMMRAFERAGVPRPVEVLRGLKMDAALVAGLTAQLGPRAKDVGLAIMGVYLREQDLANSDSAQRMQDCVLAIQEDVDADADLLRAMDARTASLKHPGWLQPHLIERLGLGGMKLKHVRQLERQGLSSAAEARAVLAVVQKSIDTLVANHSLEKAQQHGLLDVLRTRRQEDRAGTLSEALLQKHESALNDRLPDGSLKLLRPNARREIVRAAIASLVPAERDARGRTGMPVLAAFSPGLEQVRAALAKMGVHENLDKVIEEEIGDRVTQDTLATWVSEAGLLDQPALGSGTAKVPPPDRKARRLAEQRAVRAAIIEVASAAPKGTLPDRAKISKLLSRRGLHDMDQVIEKELYLPLTPARIAAWKQEAVHAEDLHRSKQAREALIDSLADVKIGTRIRMNAVQRVKATTGVFGDSLGVGGKASVGKISSVDFGNPGDPGGSWEVSLRAGFDVKAGVEVWSPFVNLSQRLGVRLGVVGGAEGSAVRYSGVVLRCKTSKDQQSVTRKMLEAEKIGFDELADVENLLFLREVQGTGELYTGIQATMQPVDAGFSWDNVRRSQFMLGARVTGHLGAQWSRSVAQNNKLSIRRVETVKFRRIAAAASATVRLKHTEGHGPNLTAPVLEAGAAWEAVEKHRQRRVAGPDGKVFDAEAFDQSFVVGSSSAVEHVKNLGGPRFERAMQFLESESPDVYEYIASLIKDVRANELASVAWVLDRNAGYYPASRAIEQANAALDHRVNTGSIKADKDTAAELRKQADRIVDDRRHYNFARSALIPTVDTAATNSYLLGLFEKSETVYAESLPVEIKLYADELLKLTRRARREVQYGVKA